MNNVACPEPEFKLFVRKRFDTIQKCLNNKVSWAMSGIIVGIFTAISLLVYNAYSGEQERQRIETAKNSTGVQELKTNIIVVRTEFRHIREKLKELKESQEKQFEAVLKILNEKGDIRP